MQSMEPCVFDHLNLNFEFCDNFGKGGTNWIPMRAPPRRHYYERVHVILSLACGCPERCLLIVARGLRRRCLQKFQRAPAHLPDGGKRSATKRNRWKLLYETFDHSKRVVIIRTQHVKITSLASRFRAGRRCVEGSGMRRRALGCTSN